MTDIKPAIDRKRKRDLSYQETVPHIPAEAPLKENSSERKGGLTEVRASERRRKKNFA